MIFCCFLGSVSRSDNLSYVCVDFMNSGCSRNLDTYYECLTDGGCYFDPFTLGMWFLDIFCCYLCFCWCLFIN